MLHKGTLVVGLAHASSSDRKQTRTWYKHSDSQVTKIERNIFRVTEALRLQLGAQEGLLLGEPILRDSCFLDSDIGEDLG